MKSDAGGSGGETAWRQERDVMNGNARLFALLDEYRPFNLDGIELDHASSADAAGKRYVVRDSEDLRDSLASIRSYSRVCSDTAVQELFDLLLAHRSGSEIRDAGTRLKLLIRLCQLRHVILRDDGKPDRIENHLCTDLRLVRNVDSFVEREEVKQIFAREADRSRIEVLSGPDGIGKRQLAIRYLTLHSGQGRKKEGDAGEIRFQQFMLITDLSLLRILSGESMLEMVYEGADSGAAESAVYQVRPLSFFLDPHLLYVIEPDPSMEEKDARAFSASLTRIVRFYAERKPEEQESLPYLLLLLSEIPESAREDIRGLSQLSVGPLPWVAQLSLFRDILTRPNRQDRGKTKDTGEKDGGCPALSSRIPEEKIRKLAAYFHGNTRILTTLAHLLREYARANESEEALQNYCQRILSIPETGRIPDNRKKYSHADDMDLHEAVFRLIPASLRGKIPEELCRLSFLVRGEMSLELSERILLDSDDDAAFLSALGQGAACGILRVDRDRDCITFDPAVSDAVWMHWQERQEASLQGDPLQSVMAELGRLEYVLIHCSGRHAYGYRDLISMSRCVLDRLFLYTKSQSPERSWDIIDRFEMRTITFGTLCENQSLVSFARNRLLYRSSERIPKKNLESVPYAGKEPEFHTKEFAGFQRYLVCQYGKAMEYWVSGDTSPAILDIFIDAAKKIGDYACRLAGRRKKSQWAAIRQEMQRSMEHHLSYLELRREDMDLYRSYVWLHWFFYKFAFVSIEKALSAADACLIAGDVVRCPQYRMTAAAVLKEVHTFQNMSYLSAPLVEKLEEALSFHLEMLDVCREAGRADRSGNLSEDPAKNFDEKFQELLEACRNLLSSLQDPGMDFSSCDLYPETDRNDIVNSIILDFVLESVILCRKTGSMRILSFPAGWWENEKERIPGAGFPAVLLEKILRAGGAVSKELLRLSGDKFRYQKDCAILEELGRELREQTQASSDTENKQPDSPL